MGLGCCYEHSELSAPNLKMCRSFLSRLSRLVFLFLTLVGLAMSTAMATANEASIGLQLVSDSENTTGIHLMVMRYGNQACAKAEKPRRLFRKKYASKDQNLSQIAIPAGEEFWLQVDYEEARRGQNRSCGTLVGFEPKAGGDYILSLKVSGQVSTCQIEILDNIEEQTTVPHILPDKSCDRVNKPGKPNGVPVHNSLNRF